MLSEVLCSKGEPEFKAVPLAEENGPDEDLSESAVRLAVLNLLRVGQLDKADRQKARDGESDRAHRQLVEVLKLAGSSTLFA